MKEMPSRDYPTCASIPHADTKPRYYCWCQEKLADRSLIQLSPVRLCQSLTNTDADRLSTRTPVEELGEGLKELKGPYLASMGGEALGPVKA